MQRLIPRTRRARLLLGALVVLLPLLGVAGIAVGLEQESHDDFCASCHTEPESTYYRQSRDRSDIPPNLSVFHAQAAPQPRPDDVDQAKGPVHCIDCHGGVDPVVRGRTFLLAVGDTIQFVTGRYEQPAKLGHPLPNVTCLHCHSASVREEGFDNHFHTRLSEPEAPRLYCTDCHTGHTPAEEFQGFIIRTRVYPQCNSCHRTMGRGPSDLR